MSCLHIENLTVRFETRSGPVTAVDDVSLDHEPGECLALVGETGCGKSVLALALLRLLPAGARVQGRVRFEGRDLLALSEREMTSVRGREIALVPQNPSLSLNPVYSIGHQIGELYRMHRNMGRRPARDRSAEQLGRMGIQDPRRRLRQYPFQFSEGMNQRALIAAAFALSPRLIIADEPTRGLDETLRDEVVRELALAREAQGTRLILITHDLTAARALGDRIAVMYAGRLVEIAPTEDFFRNPRHPYSRGLIAALPENGFQPIPGPTPSLIKPPGGCRFYPRCSMKRDICALEEPPLRRKQERWIRCIREN